VQEYVLRSWSLVKIGTTPAQKKLFFNLRRLKRKIAGTASDALSQDQVVQIADELKVMPQDVVEMDARLRGDVSLNVPVDLRDAGEDMLDRLADPSPDPERLLAEADNRAQLRASLRSALAVLTARERGIIEQRYLRERPATLDELGRGFGVSRERIRQIEQRALQKLKTAVSPRRGLAQPAEGGRSRPALRRRGTTHSDAVQAMAMAA
jgi:RNA polymerase sigma-32 factor